MTPITPSNTLQTNNYQAASTNQASSSQENKNKVVIEIKPGEDNVSSGDRSDNSVKVSISTPNHELEAEVTREEYYNAVERRTYKKLAGQALGGSQGDNSSVKAALVVKSGVIEGDDLETLAIAKNQKKQVETYVNASQNNPYNSTSGSTEESGSSSNSTNESNSSAAELTSSVMTPYYEGVNAYAKQQFVFSKIDQAKVSEKA